MVLFSGVRQGDTLSPILFNIFLNDLTDEQNQLNLGIQLGEKRIRILLISDNIASVAENETALQTTLDTLFNCYYKWYLIINNSKKCNC